MDGSTIWLTTGLLGQAMFFMRFLVQWFASERSRRSVVPRAFWYFSISGGLVLLIYACANAIRCTLSARLPGCSSTSATSC